MKGVRSKGMLLRRLWPRRQLTDWTLVFFVVPALFGPLAVAAAKPYTLDPDVNGGGVAVGAEHTVVTQFDDTLLDIARRYNLGFWEIIHANPELDAWVPGSGQAVQLPLRFVLPKGARQGIVVNVPEFRLYHFFTDETGQAWVETYPISVGRMDWTTPLGKTTITAKVKDPAWYPPASIRAEHEAEGRPLPTVVPPGPDNPLGAHAMRLGLPGYLIHGTNRPYGIGMQVTHGCIRMYPEDIAELFTAVPADTPVRIVNQQVKVGWQGDVLYMEASQFGERPFQEDEYYALLNDAVNLIDEAVGGIPHDMDWSRVKQEIRQPSGRPIAVWRRAS